MLDTEEVIQIFVNCKGIDKSSLYGHIRGTREVRYARFMLYRILREKCGESSYSLAKRFRRPRRNIVRGLSTIRDLMEIYKDIKEEYDNIVKMIEDAE